MLHIPQHCHDISGERCWAPQSFLFHQFFVSYPSASLWPSSPQLTLLPLRPFILQMLAWLCGLSFQHKGPSVDWGLASAWASASVISPRQPLAKPRGGWAWVGHEAWRVVVWRQGMHGRKRVTAVKGGSITPPLHHLLIILVDSLRSLPSNTP